MNEMATAEYCNFIELYIVLYFLFVRYIFFLCLCFFQRKVDKIHCVNVCMDMNVCVRVYMYEKRARVMLNSKGIFWLRMCQCSFAFLWLETCCENAQNTNESFIDLCVCVFSVSQSVCYCVSLVFAPFLAWCDCRSFSSSIVFRTFVFLDLFGFGFITTARK